MRAIFHAPTFSTRVQAVTGSTHGTNALKGRQTVFVRMFTHTSNSVSLAYLTIVTVGGSCRYSQGVCMVSARQERVIVRISRACLSQARPQSRTAMRVAVPTSRVGTRQGSADEQLGVSRGAVRRRSTLARAAFVGLHGLSVKSIEPITLRTK